MSYWHKSEFQDSPGPNLCYSMLRNHEQPQKSLYRITSYGHFLSKLFKQSKDMGQKSSTSTVKPALLTKPHLILCFSSWARIIK